MAQQGLYGQSFGECCILRVFTNVPRNYGSAPFSGAQPRPRPARRDWRGRCQAVRGGFTDGHDDSWRIGLERELLERTFEASAVEPAAHGMEVSLDGGRPLSWLWPTTSGPGFGPSECGAEASTWWIEPTADVEPSAATDEIYVILFGVGAAEPEGIYSLRASSLEDGLPVDTIVAFASEIDAVRYATLLEASMDHEPHVSPISWVDLEDFCKSAGYCCRLEPANSLLIPPEKNVELTDWERSRRLRCNGMLDEGGAGGMDSEEAREDACAAIDVATARALLERLFALPDSST